MARGVVEELAAWIVGYVAGGLEGAVEVRSMGMGLGVRWEGMKGRKGKRMGRGWYSVLFKRSHAPPIAAATS